MELLKSVFSGVLSMSLKAVPVILLVLLLRLVLRRVSSRWSYALWAVPLFRLICPLSIPAAVSLYNLPLLHRAATGSSIKGTASGFANSKGTSLSFSALSTSGGTGAVEQGAASAANAAPTSGGVDTLAVAAVLWGVGVLLLLGWTVFRYAQLHRQTRAAIHMEGAVWQCDNLPGPFVLGILRPKIFLPSWLDGESRVHVLAHENCHLRRHDSLIRLIGQLIAVLHWFNPLVWLGLRFMEQDMEMSCDEAALRTLGQQSRQDYSRTLLALGSGRRSYGPALAFGVPAAKKRILHVLKPRRTGRSALALGLAVLLLAGLTCCTDAAQTAPTGQIREGASDGNNLLGQLSANPAHHYDYTLPEGTQALAIAVRGTGLFESELITLWAGDVTELSGTLALEKQGDGTVQMVWGEEQPSFQFYGCDILFSLGMPLETTFVPNETETITLTRDEPSLLFTIERSSSSLGSIGTYEFYCYPASVPADSVPLLPEGNVPSQQLYEKRADYVGNASAVSGLLSAVLDNYGAVHDELCSNHTMALDTDAEPYGMNIIFTLKTDDTLSFLQRIELQREQFRIGTLMLALVENLDCCHISYDGVDGVDFNNMTTETVSQVLGVDDLKALGQSADGVAELLARIDLALDDADWDSSADLLSNP